MAATALPIQVGAYFLLWMLGIGFELGSTALGTHPLSAPVPPPGGYIEMGRAEPRERLLIGLAGSTHPQAPLWREQVALSDAFVLYPLRELPQRQQLTNTIQPPEFDDPERPIRWVFSHDRMRFVGYGTLDGRARGELGAGPGQTVFPGPALPFANGYVYTPGVAYQYDAQQQRLFPRVRLPGGEVFASPPEPAGENLAVLSNRALYFHPGREAGNTLDLLAPLMRVALPGAIGHLGSVELVELLDGYLVSFSYTYGAWAGEMMPWQLLVHVDGSGTVHRVAHRQMALDLPLAYTMRAWWLSPMLRTISVGATQLFAAPAPLKEGALPAPPRHLVLLAASLCALSLLGALLLGRRQRLRPGEHAAWVLACGVIGLPALASLWLLHPLHECDESLPVAQAAKA